MFTTMAAATAPLSAYVISSEGELTELKTLL